MRYNIYTLENNFIMSKTKEEMKEWISKYSIKDYKENKVDLRKANKNSNIIIRVNGKALVVRSNSVR